MEKLNQNRTLRMAISAMPSVVGKIKYALDSDNYTDERARIEKICFEMRNLKDCIDVLEEELTRASKLPEEKLEP